MIPKIIHYCWFGNNKKPESIEKYIKTWKKHLPDYKIIEWNENNFDINYNQFVKEAYSEKKWAFVTDYVRLYALKEYGGIYMDSDVEVVKNLDEFLSNKAFTGTEDGTYSITGVMGAVKNHIWINDLISYYENKSFYNEDGSLDLTPNTQIINTINVNKYGWIPNNNLQVLKEGLKIYPSDYLCAKSFIDGKVKITNNTYTVHHFQGSWLSDLNIKRNKRRIKFVRIFGKKLGNNMFYFFTSLKDEGFIKTIKKVFKRREK